MRPAPRNARDRHVAASVEEGTGCHDRDRRVVDGGCGDAETSEGGAGRGPPPTPAAGGAVLQRLDPAGAFGAGRRPKSLCDRQAGADDDVAEPPAKEPRVPNQRHQALTADDEQRHVGRCSNRRRVGHVAQDGGLAEPPTGRQLFEPSSLVDGLGSALLDDEEPQPVPAALGEHLSRGHIDHVSDGCDTPHDTCRTTPKQRVTAQPGPLDPGPFAGRPGRPHLEHGTTVRRSGMLGRKARSALGEPADRPAVAEDRADELRRASSVVRMVYQPIFDLRSGHVHGFEALARFQVEPPRPPEVCFAEAAAAGVGVDLECHAIRLAARALPDLPKAIRLSVNASPAAVQSGKVALCLADLDSGRVTVELTEHSDVEDYAQLERRLIELRGLGVRVAVDDAGAGVSRLPHIAKVWPDVIKLDRSLTSAVGTGDVAAGHSRAVVSFAEEFKIEVVAEGIETNEELEAVKGLRVRYGQGFLLGRPQELEHWRTTLNPR